MARQNPKIKKYKVLQAILDKGKHYKIGMSVDETMMDKKVIKRLSDPKLGYLKEDKDFPEIPKNASVEELEMAVASLTEDAELKRRKAIKEVRQLQKQEKRGLAATKNRISRAEYEITLSYIEDIKKVIAEKNNLTNEEKVIEENTQKKAEREKAEKKS